MLFAYWTGAIINLQWLELPMSRTNFYGPKDDRAIEIRLYTKNFTTKKQKKKKQKKDGKISYEKFWYFFMFLLKT